MSDRIVTLAVTRMLSGMCTGGISESTNRWVRPVKEFGTITLGDLAYADRTVMRPFDVVQYSFSRQRPKPPHVEDWICDLVHSRPRLIRRMDEKERAEYLEKSVEPDAPVQLGRLERSLALIKPEFAPGPVASFALDPYTGKFGGRLLVPEMGERALPVTDIKWRALGRKVVTGGGRVLLTLDDLRSRLGIEQIYVALGLSRTHEGKNWALVVGVHTLPDYEAEVDYRRL